MQRAGLFRWLISAYLYTLRLAHHPKNRKTPVNLGYRLCQCVIAGGGNLRLYGRSWHDTDPETPCNCLAMASPMGTTKRTGARAEAMKFPEKPSLADTSEIGNVIVTHKEGNVLFAKMPAGLIQRLLTAHRHLFGIRDAMRLLNKASNATRSLGSHVFGSMELR